MDQGRARPAGPAAFVYLAARLFYPVDAGSALLPEALTREKARRFEGQIGKVFTLHFDLTPFPLHRSDGSRLMPVTTIAAELRETTWTPAATADPGARELDLLDALDGQLDLVFESADHDGIVLISDRRDPDQDATRAFERRIRHWGTENWGGLTVVISLAGEQLYRCDADAFAIDDSDLLSGIIHFSALSFDPDTYGKAAASPAGPAETVSDPGNAAPRHGSAEAAGRADPDARSRETGEIVRCMRCGNGLDIGLAALSGFLVHSDTIVNTFCSSCGYRYQVRVLNQRDQLRTGTKYAVRDLGTRTKLPDTAAEPGD